MSDKAAMRTQINALLQQNRQNLEILATEVRRHIHTRLAHIPGASVAFYHAFWDEVDLTPLIPAYTTNGGNALLPAIQPSTKILDFRLWTPDATYVPGLHGTVEPSASTPIIQPTHLLVPLRAFDASGHRLGRGGGYYDATLAHLRMCNPDLIAWGVAYEMQRMPHLPSEDHDQLLNGIITEAGFHDPT